MSLDYAKEANIATIVGSIIAGFSLVAIFLQLLYHHLSTKKEKTIEYVRKFEDSDFSNRYVNAFSWVYQKHKEVTQNQFYSHFLILNAKKQLENPINFVLTSNILLTIQYFNNLGSLYYHNIINRRLLSEIFGERIVYTNTIFKWLFIHNKRIEISKEIYGDIKGLNSVYQSSYWDSMSDDIRIYLESMNRTKVHPLSHLECIKRDKSFE